MGKLFVGNLPFKMTDVDLKAEFERVGEVKNSTVIMDKETGRSRGFGFVEMDESDKAIRELNGVEIGGRAISVSIAREREERKPHGGRERSYR